MSPTIFQLNPTTNIKPSGRQGHTLTLLDSSYAVLFGGRAKSVASSGGQRNILGDLWLFSFEHGTWTELEAAGDARPEARHNHAAVSWRGSIVVVGGALHDRRDCSVWQMSIDSTIDGDDGTAKQSLRWKELGRWDTTPTSSQGAERPRPAPRAGHSVILYGDYLIVFGGSSERAEVMTTPPYYNDTWAFDLVRERWHQVHAGSTPGARAPIARNWHTATLLPPHLNIPSSTSLAPGSRMILFGGYTWHPPSRAKADREEYHNDTWSFSLPGGHSSSPSSKDNQWTCLSSPTETQNPLPRNRHSAVLIAKEDDTLAIAVHGGNRLVAAGDEFFGDAFVLKERQPAEKVELTRAGEALRYNPLVAHHTSLSVAASPITGSWLEKQLAASGVDMRVWNKSGAVLFGGEVQRTRSNQLWAVVYS